MLEVVAGVALRIAAVSLWVGRIIAVILVGGERADRWLQAGGRWLQRRWPVVLASLLGFIGSVLAVLGGAGLIRQ